MTLIPRKNLCLGGPRDKEYCSFQDFVTETERAEYWLFHSSWRFPDSFIFVHSSLLKSD